MTVILFIVISLMAISSSGVWASPPAPAPKCNVVGIIENVRYEAAHVAPCFTTKTCPTDTQTQFPEAYYLTVNVISASYKEGDTRFQSCGEIYPIGLGKEIYILKEKIIDGDQFKAGQNITGTAVSFGRESFESYKIERVASENSPAEIEKKPAGLWQRIKLFFSDIIKRIYG